MLTAGKGVTKDYLVQSGDTIWKIAKSNNMGINEIASLNPELNVDKLQIGQTIKLSVSEPYLNVEATEKVAYDQDIPYDTTYVSSGDVYRGQTSVVKSGEYGVRRITEQITKVNGVKVAGSTLSSDVVKDPVTRVVAKGTKELVGSGRFMWPANGTISSLFGARGWEYHRGIDIAAPRGTGICAADSGTVIISRRYYDYGLLVAIDHGNGYVTYYGHCSALIASEGESVQKGQLIARVGSTGDSTGNHIHFEVRKNGVPQNPLRYLR
jgi:murein DD-endopeptidase MepM/ murein hydrolase activator NlpD